jgi:hypothetical protein
MSIAPWFFRHFLSKTPRCTTRKIRKPRLAIDQLEDRLTPSHTVAVSIVDPPATFFEGAAVNLTSSVDGASGSQTYAWSVLKDGQAFTTTFAAENLAPVATITGPTSAALGETVEVLFGGADAGADEAAGFFYHYDADNDGYVDEIFAASTYFAGGMPLTFQFNEPGVYTFAVMAEDKDGGASGRVTHSITVAADAPAEELPPEPVAVVDGVLVVRGTAGDDRIQITPAGKDGVRVRINGEDFGVFDGVSAIEVLDGAGNDSVHVAGSKRRK